jgi:glutamate synthase domain-containing protein 3
MENFGLRDVIYISIAIGTGIATFLTTKHKLKEYVRDSVDSLKDKIHAHEVEMERLKGRDENQQQIIDTFQKQVLDHLPALYEIATNAKKSKK